MPVWSFNCSHFVPPLQPLSPPPPPLPPPPPPPSDSCLHHLLFLLLDYFFIVAINIPSKLCATNKNNNYNNHTNASNRSHRSVDIVAVSVITKSISFALPALSLVGIGTVIVRKGPYI